MPLVEIFTTKWRNHEQKRALLQITCSSVSEIFCVAENDVTVWLHEFKSENVLYSGKEADAFNAFLVHCFSGRSDEQKKRLYSLLFRRLQEAGETDNAFQLTVEESPMKNWGLDGGISADVFLLNR